MRLRILSLLSLSIAVSCAPLDESTTTRSESSNDINVVQDEDGNLGFDVKLPENHGTLAGKSFNLSAISVDETSAHIKLECLGGILKDSSTKIRISLYNTHTKVTHQAVFAYNCAKGARAKLAKLEKGHSYLLNIGVFNDKGLIFAGKSGVFQSTALNVVIKMERIKENSDVNVEIVFPTDPVVNPPKPSESFIVCDFTAPNYGDIKSPGETVGYYDNNFPRPSLGGTCKVALTELNNTPGDLAVAPKMCTSNGSSCVLELGALKEKKSFHLAITSRACSGQNIEKVVTVLPGQILHIKACPITVQPPLPPVNPPVQPPVQPPLPPVNPPIQPPKPPVYPSKPYCSFALVSQSYADLTKAKVGQVVELAFVATHAKIIGLAGEYIKNDNQESFAMEVETQLKANPSEVSADVVGEAGVFHCSIRLPAGI